MTPWSGVPLAHRRDAGWSVGRSVPWWEPVSPASGCVRLTTWTPRRKRKRRRKRRSHPLQWLRFLRCRPRRRHHRQPVRAGSPAPRVLTVFAVRPVLVAALRAPGILTAAVQQAFPIAVAPALNSAAVKRDFLCAVRPIPTLTAVRATPCAARRGPGITMGAAPRPRRCVAVLASPVAAVRPAVSVAQGRSRV